MFRRHLADRQFRLDARPLDHRRGDERRHPGAHSGALRINKVEVLGFTTRTNLGLMLGEGILKENIDGEALIWAHERLRARAEQRRILMVISDGAPVDNRRYRSTPETTSKSTCAR